MQKNRFRLTVLATSFLLAACAHRDCCVGSQVPPEADWHEYVVYRIDENRYITLRSPEPCDGYLDGDIYYNDSREGVRTFVSFTGSMSNGFYSGYYAVQSDPKYVAIPSLAFSEISGMRLHINFSHDGGRTFQGFLAGPSGIDDDVVILDGKELYVASKNYKNTSNYSKSPGIVFDISQDMDRIIASSSASPTAFDEYGKIVNRSKVPFNLKSASNETHWTCQKK